MSVFGKLFGGGGKGGKAPNPQEAIQKLRETEEMLTKKQEYLEQKIDAELLTAKKNGTKNKRGLYFKITLHIKWLFITFKDHYLSCVSVVWQLTLHPCDTSVLIEFTSTLLI